MRSLYDFIITPLGNRYENEIKLGDKTLVLNTKIESFKSVNNLAVVIETPKAFKTNIKKGDIVVVHHNVFRVFYDMKGVKKNSRSYFKDDLYFCAIDQIYLYKNTGDWKSFGDRCFVMPLKNKDSLELDKEQKLIGILAEEAIVGSEDDLSADKLKNAAATKKLAIFDAFEILARIELEENLLNDKPEEAVEEQVFRGFAEGRSR